MKETVQKPANLTIWKMAIKMEGGTVKPLMFTCPLFHKFCENNKTVKLKGANTNTVPTVISAGVEKVKLLA